MPRLATKKVPFMLLDLLEAGTGYIGERREGGKTFLTLHFLVSVAYDAYL